MQYHLLVKFPVGITYKEISEGKLNKNITKNNIYTEYFKQK